MCSSPANGRAMGVPILQVNTVRDKEVRCLSKVTQLICDKACDQTQVQMSLGCVVLQGMMASTVGLLCGLH